MAGNGGMGKAQRGPDLTDGPILSTLLIFALPALGSNILQSVNGSINAVWIGQYLGETGLAATANANLIMFMLLSVVFGFGMAATIAIGQSMGRGDVAAMRRAVGTGLGLFFVLGTLASILGWFTTPALLHMLGTPETVYTPAYIYLRVMFLGLPFSLLTVFMGMALRGVGDSMTPLILTIPGVILAIILNPLLIAGIGPIPPLGIMGSAIATLLSNLLSFVIMMATISIRDLPIRLKGPEWRYLLPDRDLLGMILRKGIPMGLQMIVMSGSALVMLGLVNREGTDTVAGYGAITQIWTYIQMPAIAIGMAVSAMAAQNIGAGRWDRVDGLARSGLVVNVLLTGSLVALTALLDRAALGIFLPDASNAVAIAAHIDKVGSWSFILMGATMVYSSITRANGATIWPLIVMILAYIPGRLGAAYALRPMLGADAIWFSFPIGAALSLLLTAVYYYQGSWRKGSLLATVVEAEEFVQSEAEPAGRPLPSG